MGLGRRGMGQVPRTESGSDSNGWYRLWRRSPRFPAPSRRRSAMALAVVRPAAVAV